LRQLTAPHGWGNPAGRVNTPTRPVLPLEEAGRAQARAFEWALDGNKNPVSRVAVSGSNGLDNEPRASPPGGFPMSPIEPSKLKTFPRVHTFQRTTLVWRTGLDPGKGSRSRMGWHGLFQTDARARTREEALGAYVGARVSDQHWGGWPVKGRCRWNDARSLRG